MFLTSKRFWKRVAIGSAAVLGVLVTAIVGLHIWLNSRLQTRLSHLRAAGEPTSIRELEIPVPTDGNAALTLSEIRPQLDAFTKAQIEFEKTGEGMNYAQFGYMEEQLTAEQLVAIRALVESFPTLPAAIDRAADSPYYGPLLDYSLGHLAFQDEVMEGVKLLRIVSRFNSLRVAIAVSDKKFDEAALIGINMLQLARLNDSQPLLVSGLVGFALRRAAVRELNRVLRAGELLPETYLLIDQELTLHDHYQGMVNLLKTERAYNMEASQEIFTHIPLIGTAMKIDTLEFHEQLASIVAKPWHQAKDEFNGLEAQEYTNPISKTVMALLMPGLRAANDANQRTLMQLRCVRILCALKSYRQSSGREAEELGKLGLLASATRDPFSSDPLKVKLTGEGWVIYSVMKNGKDDGGNFEDEKDWGVAPVGYPGPE